MILNEFRKNMMNKLYIINKNLMSISFIHLKKFLKKYFFILKAAAEGWVVSYIGNNIFIFQYRLNNNKKDSYNSSVLTNILL